MNLSRRLGAERRRGERVAAELTSVVTLQHRSMCSNPAMLTFSCKVP